MTDVDCTKRNKMYSCLFLELCTDLTRFMKTIHAVPCPCHQSVCPDSQLEEGEKGKVITMNFRVESELRHVSGIPIKTHWLALWSHALHDLLGELQCQQEQIQFRGSKLTCRESSTH